MRGGLNSLFSSKAIRRKNDVAWSQLQPSVFIEAAFEATGRNEHGDVGGAIGTRSENKGRFIFLYGGYPKDPYQSTLRRLKTLENVKFVHRDDVPNQLSDLEFENLSRCHKDSINPHQEKDG